MDFFSFLLKNLFNFYLLFFVLGFLIGFIDFKFKFEEKIKKIITGYLLFCVGMKGGVALGFYETHASFFSLLGVLLAFGFLQPVFLTALLKYFKKLDEYTAIAIAASFGSVSIITFMAGVSFLEKVQAVYNPYLIGVLAVMEIPAIITAFFLLKYKQSKNSIDKTSFRKLIAHTLFNKVIFLLLIGLLSGFLISFFEQMTIKEYVLKPFQVLLATFLFFLGMQIRRQNHQFKTFSFSLVCFGLYVPLLSGLLGLFLSAVFHLDPGSATLVALIMASSSYIAVPAAMKLLVPSAKEAIYVPLSLGVAFPFNVILGVPFYYYLAKSLL